LEKLEDRLTSWFDELAKNPSEIGRPEGIRLIRCRSVFDRVRRNEAEGTTQELLRKLEELRDTIDRWPRSGQAGS
jgi:hypothetical protein